jgi:hypothetical protein
MSRLDLASATGLAHAKIDQLASSVGDQFELVLEQTKEIEQGWIFFYNTADFIRTRNPIYTLAGNGPILVTRTGIVHVLPSATPWEDAVKQI